MKKKIFNLLSLLIYLIYSNYSFAITAEKADREKVIVGIDINVAPMGFRNENGEITGFDVDLAKETFKVLNKEVIFQPIDWDAKELELNTGKIDVIWNGLSYSPERSQNMLLTKPYMQNRQVIIVKSNSTINNLKDLHRKSICVQKGSTGAIALKNSNINNQAKNVVELESMIDCLNEIKLNKSDATVVDEVVARYYLNKNSLKSEFKILDQELSREDYVIGLKKDNVTLKEQLENALAQVIENKTAEQISQKWFGKKVISFNDVTAKSSKPSEQTNLKQNSTSTELFNGVKITLKLFFVCLIFAVPLGLILCFLRISKVRSIKALISIYIWIMRSTPLLLQIFFLFYGLPLLFPNFQINDRFLIGTVAFILNYAAYFAEIFRGGLKSIDKGQWEAIEVLQIPKPKAIFKIIIPQVIRVCLPTLCNETVTLVKDTALIFSIGVIELLTAAKNLVNSQASITPYIIVCAIYLIICSIITLIFKLFEKKLNFNNQQKGC